MSEARLQAALTRAAFVMLDMAECLTVEASNYQEAPVDERYRPIIKKLLAGSKAAAKAAKAPKPKRATEGR